MHDFDFLIAGVRIENTYRELANFHFLHKFLLISTFIWMVEEFLLVSKPFLE